MKYRLRDRVLDFRDRIRATPMVERAMSVRVDAPARLTTWVLIGLALIGLFLFQAWYVQHQTSKWWRQKLASSSVEVRTIVKHGDAEIDVTDDQIIKAIGDTDAKRRDAEAELKRLRGSKPDDGCALVPRACLRLGGVQ